MLNGLRCSHDTVNPGVEAHLLDVFRSSRRRGTGTTTVPNTAYLISGNYLCEQTCRYVPDFNEAGIEEKYVGPVDCHALSRALPFNGARVATRCAVLVDVDSELWGLTSVLTENQIQTTDHHNTKGIHFPRGTSPLAGKIHRVSQVFHSHRHAVE